MIYDLTPPISERLKVWPGDTSPSRQVLCDMKQGANLTLSTLHATVHLGAHADAPSHYAIDGPAIHERNLDYYLGPLSGHPRCRAPDGSLWKKGTSMGMDQSVTFSGYDLAVDLQLAPTESPVRPVGEQPNHLRRALHLHLDEALRTESC